LEICNLIKKYNSLIENPKWRINLSGVGAGCGDDNCIAHDGKIFGKSYSRTFIIGEDMVSNGEVCVTEELYELVKGEAALKNITFEVDNQLKESNNLVYYHLKGTVDYKIPDIEPWKPTGQFVDHFQARLEPGANVLQIDEDINKTCLRHNSTIMMFGIKNSQDNIQQFSTMYAAALNIIHGQCKLFEGQELEPCLILFSDPNQALKAALGSVKGILEYNKGKDGEHKIDVNGFGLHIGSMLFYPGAFHIGDPINTSSKLGEDLAEGLEVLVSTKCWEAIDKALFSQFVNVAKDLEASGNKLPALSFAASQFQ